MEKKPRTKKSNSYDINGIKELVLWMKKEKVASFQLKDLAVNFSPHAFINEVDYPSASEIKDTRTEEQIKAEEEELMFASSNIHTKG